MRRLRRIRCGSISGRRTPGRPASSRSSWRLRLDARDDPGNRRGGTSLAALVPGDVLVLHEEDSVVGANRDVRDELVNRALGCHLSPPISDARWGQRPRTPSVTRQRIRSSWKDPIMIALFVNLYGTQSWVWTSPNPTTWSCAFCLSDLKWIAPSTMCSMASRVWSLCMPRSRAIADTTFV